jgi:dolichol-phosphate mannosyltransferase
MRSNERPDGATATERLSLILPLPPGTVLDNRLLTDYRRLLEGEGTYKSVEIIVSGAEDDRSAMNCEGGGPSASGITLLRTDGGEWSDLARAGLSVATGDHLMVLDLERHYAPESLLGILEPVSSGEAELAVAVPPRGRFARLGVAPLQSSLGLASRMVLGSSDVFSGLFVLRRSLWERGGRRLTASGASLVLELLLRRPRRCRDVPVPVGPQFRRQRFQLQDLRPLKHVLDGRYGSLSRLIQFCCVGASGMVVDLSFYALFQWILSYTPLYTAGSGGPGFSWHLAIAGALSIAIALVWNFTLNRRLTFNDARGGSWVRQFLTYALSNAVAIALSFTLRLYLPANVAFFGRHRLAAAVVGIVAATGVSFSMSRWIVFSRRPELQHTDHTAGQPQVSSPSEAMETKPEPVGPANDNDYKSLAFSDL